MDYCPHLQIPATLNLEYFPIYANLNNRYVYIKLK